MFENPSVEEVQEALETLRELHITRVEITFSGGNDEGGADGVTAFDTQSNEVDVPKGRAYRNGNLWQVYEFIQHRSSSRPATEDEITWSRVRDVLEGPIYERWGSFAGEFYVQGTLTWDVVKGTHEMHGQESFETYESF